MAGITSLTVVTITGAMVFGLVTTFLGSVKLALADRLQLKESRVAALLSVLNLALIPMTLLSGYLIGAWSVRGVLIAGSILVALGLGLLALKHGYEWALAAVLLIGAGGACVSAASIVLMPKAFDEPTKLFQRDTAEPAAATKETTAAINLGNVFVGLGALLAPIFVSLLLTLLGYRRMMLGLALMCLVPAVLAAVIEIPRMPGGTDMEKVVLHKDVPLWLAGLVCFLYFPVQYAVSTWGTTYLHDQGYPERRAELVLSLFWLAFLSSQLGVAMLELYGYVPASLDPWLIVLLAFLAGLGLGNLAGAATEASAVMGFVLLGAALGPIFPTLVGVVFNHVPQVQWGTAYGVVFALGSLGSLLLSPFIGLYANRNSVREAMRIPMILALVLAGAALALALALQLAPAPK
jgi:FHS family glucose/mannose:H+ symporter-like MFS transporter